MAASLLVKNSEMYPIAVVLDQDGQPRFLAAWDGNDFPTSGVLEDIFYETFLVQKDSLRATVIASDVRIAAPDGRDAIKLLMEHHEGFAVMTAVPYHLDGQTLTFDELITEPADPKVWLSH